jgi:tRNA threonylcarbamoyladenosine biosynthesis protein TsaB
MSCILCLETATSVCSVAVAIDGDVLSFKESDILNSHASLLTPFIEDVLREAGLALDRLDAVAVSKGPGSYTGLRIGVSTAKGLCYALDRPLIAVGTLEAMAAGMAARIKNINTMAAEKCLLCPMIDARRMEVYDALYDLENNRVRETKAEIIDGQSFAEFFRDHAIYFFGDNAAKCKPYLAHRPNAVFIDDFLPSARHLAGPAEERYRKKMFEDIAYFEPFYLKDFIPGKPKVKGLG